MGVMRHVAVAGAIIMVPASVACAAPAAAQPYVRIAELEIDPLQVDEYKAILATEQEASVRTEPGVVMLHSVAIANQPNHIRLLEVYASRSAYEAHVTSPHFLRYKTATQNMVISLKLIDTQPILLCAKVPGGSDSGDVCR